MTPEAYRLSGFLYSLNPMRRGEIPVNFYDNVATLMMQHAKESAGWDLEIKFMLKEMGTDQLTEDKIYCFLALSI